MARWECIVCGLIYDEKKGWPEDGIAPGTRWADVPDDWYCPDCGVGKEDFELIAGSEDELVVETSVTSAESAPAETISRDDQAHRHIVILGAGLAGYGLAKEIRRLSQTLTITIITGDGGEAYSKPALSTGLGRGIETEALVSQNATHMAQQYRLNVLTRTHVTAIDTASSSLQLAHGGCIHYDDLVLALGADPIKPPIAGDAVDAIFTVNDLDDYRRFRQQLQQKKPAQIAVIGAGLIGCEFTNDLLSGGYQVNTIDPLQWCVPNLLPETAGRAVAQALTDAGAHFHFGVFATEVNAHDDGYRVTMSDDQTLDCDAVLCAVGVRPRTALATDAGIKTARGIVADRYLRTSVNNVYTLGDCAEVDGEVLVYVAPLTAAARALAQTLTGDATQVVYPNTPILIKTPTCPITVAPPPIGASGHWDIQGQAPNITAEFHDDDQVLRGFALTGTAVSKRDTLMEQLD